MFRKEEKTTLNKNSLKTNNATVKIDFKDYSKKYDLLLNYSPPYKKLVNTITNEIKKHYKANEEFTVLDIGGGTGNFAESIANNFPNATITFLEPDENMLNIAKTKLANKNVKFKNKNFQQFEEAEKFDLIICIHALYLMPNPKKVVDEFKNKMHQNSKLLVCDIGKILSVKNWSLYLFFQNLKKHGLIKTYQIFKLGKEVTVANKEIERKQKSGELWLHNLEQFKSYFTKNYNLLSSKITYRTYSNLVICKAKN